MAGVLSCGVAVIDFVFSMDSLPSEAKKYRAENAAIVGGGCAATAAIAVARLGGQSSLASRLGKDPVGDMILSGLEAEHVDCGTVRSFPGRRSSFSSIYIDGQGERQIVNYRDPTLPEETDWLPTSIPSGIDAVLADNRWTSGAVALLNTAKAQGLPAVLDAERPMDDGSIEAIAAASHVAFSAEGLQEYAGPGDMRRQITDIANETGNWVCVTDGANGVFWTGDSGVEHCPAYQVDVIDTLGAGDTWHGAFALALAEKQTIQDAISFASAAAAIKCSRFGGRDGIPTRVEVDSFIQERKV
ncbi:MAG: PfkB family carbohydrate kinase [Stappiaceae bacterium]